MVIRVFTNIISPVIERLAFGHRMLLCSAGCDGMTDKQAPVKSGVGGLRRKVVRAIDRRVCHERPDALFWLS